MSKLSYVRPSYPCSFGWQYVIINLQKCFLKKCSPPSEKPGYGPGVLHSASTVITDYCLGLDILFLFITYYSILQFSKFSPIILFQYLLILFPKKIVSVQIYTKREWVHKILKGNEFTKLLKGNKFTKLLKGNECTIRKRKWMSVQHNRLTHVNNCIYTVT